MYIYTYIKRKQKYKIFYYLGNYLFPILSRKSLFYYLVIFTIRHCNKELRAETSET